MIPLDDALRPTWLFGADRARGLRPRRLLRAGRLRRRATARRSASSSWAAGGRSCNATSASAAGWAASAAAPTSAASASAAPCPGFPTSSSRSWISRRARCCRLQAVMTYGTAMRALRRFTQDSLNRRAGVAAQRRAGATDAAADAPGSATATRSMAVEPLCFRCRRARPRACCTRWRRAFGAAAPPTARDATRCRPSTIATARSSSSCRPSSSWRISTRASAKAYVSPHIEATLGFSQQEWLEDPVRWYRADPSRRQGALERARPPRLLLTGEPLRSVYRVIARDGRVVWFHCEAKIVRRDDGQPWFIHGVAFDITDLKQAETALEEERNFVSAILDTVGALVVVLDPAGRIVRFNRACERDDRAARSTRCAAATSGICFRDRPSATRFASAVRRELLAGGTPASYESRLDDARRTPPADRLVAAPCCATPGGASAYIIATGIDVTERKRLEARRARHQRARAAADRPGSARRARPAPDRHRVHEQGAAAEAGRAARCPERAEARKIVQLVNEAIEMTRELSRGLLPVVVGAARPHVGARSAGRRGRGPVPHLLPLRRATTRSSVARRRRRDAPVSHRAGSREQRHQHGARDEIADRPCAPGSDRPPDDQRQRRRASRQSATAPCRAWACTS